MLPTEGQSVKSSCGKLPRSCCWPAEELLIILNAAIFSIIRGSDNRVSVPEHPTQQGSTVVLCTHVVNRKIRILKIFSSHCTNLQQSAGNSQVNLWATSSSRRASKALEK